MRPAISAALAVALDIRDADAIAGAVARAVEAFGGIDVLINNAGLESSQWLALETPESIRDVVRLNLEAPMVLTHLKKHEHDLTKPERLASCGRIRVRTF